MSTVNRAHFYRPLCSFLSARYNHCLAKHWNDFHQESLDDFVEFAFQKVDKDVHEPLPARFMLLHQRMWRGGWLQSYQDLSNIEFALHRMSQRSPRMADLTTTFEVLDGEYAALEANFSELYQDVLRQSLEFHQQLISS